MAVACGWESRTFGSSNTGSEMKNVRVRRVAAVVGIAILAMFCLSFIPVSALGNAAASMPSSVSAAAPAKVVAQPVETTSHPATGSPHPGTLQIYEAAGGGPTVDPAVAYYTVDAEPIENVYETLIGYNGTDTVPTPDGFTPQAATCVPGSNTCNAQFGSTLVYNNLTTGAPQYYTFEIDSGAHFYDPGTGVSWPVYPSDVLFSFARTIAWANQPGVGVYNGWINAQDILPSGNASWDGAIHAPYNNTPENFYAGILVNDSAYCPTSTIVSTNGCVTFNVGPSGLAWPYFLELVADNLGGSIVPCGVFTAVGAGVPGFLGSSAPNGDGPCLLPGNATSSTSAAFQTYLSTLTPTAWDSFEDLGSTNYPYPQASVSQYMVGSGPYASTSVSVSEGYFLEANPAYQQPVGCAGQTGCLPAPGAYIPNVDVYWNNGDTQGIQEMIAGQADSAGFDLSHTSDILQLVSEGKYGLIHGIPTFTVLWYPMEMNFSATSVGTIDSTGQLNVPGNWFSYDSMRNFVVQAYPYQTSLDTTLTVDGIAYGENYCGAIPQDMGNYYPTNISSCPNGDPVGSPSTPGNVQWWWYQMNNPNSPYYDPEVAAYSPSNPAKWPIVSVIGTPTEDTQVDLLISEIETFSNDTLQPYRIDVAGSTLINQLGLAPGDGSMPQYGFGWAPDYPDPTDYAAPTYYPDNAYTYTDAAAEQMTSPAFNNTTACGNANYGSWAALEYWAGIGQIPDACQGVAYDTALYWMYAAAHLTNIPQRVLDYNMVEHIMVEEGLYIYYDQELGAADYGSWINPSTINTNPMLGGGGDQLWYDWGYASNAFTTTFSETGLPTGTSWSATLAGVTQTSTTSSIVFANQVNGTSPFTIGYVPGFGASLVSGNVTIAGDDQTVSVAFTSLGTNVQTLTVNEQGLVSNTTWSVTLGGIGAIVTNQPSVTYAVPSNTYAYTPGTVTGYGNSGAGSVTVAGSPASVTITYAPDLFQAYDVNFTESGLPAGLSWTVTLGGYSLTSTASTISFVQTNGTYAYSFVVPPSVTAPPGSTLTVNGTSVSVPVTLTPVSGLQTVTWYQSGLATSAAWSVTVTVNGTGHTFASNANGTVVAQLPSSAAAYAYTVNAPTGWVATPASGSVLVNGTAAWAVVVFSVPAPTYTATFSETGLSTGGTWYVFTNGQQYSGSSSTITVSGLVNGTYYYAIVVPSGQNASPAHSAFVVDGANPTTITVTITTPATPTSSSSPSSTYMSPLAYALVGIFVLLTIIFAALAARGRKPPTGNPPQSWSPTSDSSSSGGGQTPPPPTS